MGSSWSGDEPDVSGLMNHADQLMYIAKQNYYKTTYNLSKHYRPETYQQLMEALKENRFTVYIQPKADLESGRILGGEALIRYLHPQMGVIPPARFVPVLENEHLIRVIDLFVLDEVCQMQQRRQRQSRNAAVLSLNFSRLTLLEENMALEVEKILSRYDFDPSLIEIEITETVGEIEKETLRTVIQSLKRLHLRISLDDFGTKYTNLSMLTVADFDVLKLDRSLIQGLVDSAQNQIIVASIISMCHQLGVSVIAEGVETEAQRDKLRQLGCSLGKGISMASRCRWVISARYSIRIGNNLIFRGEREEWPIFLTPHSNQIERERPAFQPKRSLFFYAIFRFINSGLTSVLR